MKKLQNARKTLRKNNKKGFTLIELIVVIVILAILMAALAPAVLGAINRANESADQADCRTLIMAGSVAALVNGGFTGLSAQDVLDEISGGSNVNKGEYTVYFSEGIAVGCAVTGGRFSSGTQIGECLSTNAEKVPISVP